MSLLNNPDQMTHGSINRDGGVGAAGRGTTQFEMQAALIPDESKFEYASAQELVRSRLSIPGPEMNISYIFTELSIVSLT